MFSNVRDCSWRNTHSDVQDALRRRRQSADVPDTPRRHLPDNPDAPQHTQNGMACLLLFTKCWSSAVADTTVSIHFF